MHRILKVISIVLVALLLSQFVLAQSYPDDIYCIESDSVVQQKEIYFTSINEQGFELEYIVYTDTTAFLTSHDIDGINYPNITNDTLVVPEYAYRGDSAFKVVGLDCYAINGVFSGLNQLTTVYLPKTIHQVEEEPNYSGQTEFYLENGINAHFCSLPALQNIYVDADNPYYCDVDGILFSKNKKRIVAYPPGRTETFYAIPEGVITIGPNAFAGCSNIKKIDFPSSLKKICGYAFQKPFQIDEFILKDSVEYIGYCALTFRYSNQKIVIGSKQLKYINGSGINSEQLFLYSTNPPTVKASFIYANKMDLFVPRKSIQLYREHEVWGQFAHIYPIEPPVVAGVNEVEVSWVQNFSATGYQWILYTDPEHTQMYITINFDNQGQFTGIVLPSLAPMRRAEGDTEQHADYYSFTINGLQANTSYYYEQNALRDEEIISSTSGEFTTLQDVMSDIQTPLNSLSDDGKFFQDGQLIIRHCGRSYNILGAEVKY